MSKEIKVEEPYSKRVIIIYRDVSEKDMHIVITLIKGLHVKIKATVIVRYISLNSTFVKGFKCIALG